MKKIKTMIAATITVAMVMSPIAQAHANETEAGVAYEESCATLDTTTKVVLAGVAILGLAIFIINRDSNNNDHSKCCH